MTSSVCPVWHAGHSRQRPRRPPATPGYLRSFTQPNARKMMGMMVPVPEPQRSSNSKSTSNSSWEMTVSRETSGQSVRWPSAGGTSSVSPVLVTELETKLPGGSPDRAASLMFRASSLLSSSTCMLKLKEMSASVPASLTEMDC